MKGRLFLMSEVPLSTQIREAFGVTIRLAVAGELFLHVPSYMCHIRSTAVLNPILRGQQPS
jgi:hypothetical protein